VCKVAATEEGAAPSLFSSELRQPREVAMRSKKARERALLNGFRTRCLEFPTGAVHEAEAPDFVVGEGARSVRSHTRA
jgi:hypothetical protein